MSHPYDATIKDILGLDAADLAPVLHLPTHLPSRTLNVDLSTISTATDVAFGFGEPLEQMVDLNFQSGPDARVDSRVHLYSAALHLRFGVPVRSVLIIRLDPVRSEPHRTASNCSSPYNRSVVTFV